MSIRVKRHRVCKTRIYKLSFTGPLLGHSFDRRKLDVCILYLCRPSSFQVSAENSKLVVSNRRAVLEQEMKELSRGDVVEG